MRTLLCALVAAVVTSSLTSTSQPATRSVSGTITTATSPWDGPTSRAHSTIKALPPEDYLAVALPEVSATEYSDPEFLETLRPLATSFSLGEGESKTLALTVRKRP
jgi:hypothetical protein